MKINTLFLLLVLLSTGLDAQVNKLAVGTKLQITQISKLDNKSSMMGQDIDMVSNSTMTAAVEIKSIVDSTIVVSSTVKRIQGTVSAMGQEQRFDTDDKSTMSSPTVSDALKDFNKPIEYTVVNGKIKGQNGKTEHANLGSSFSQGMDANSAAFVSLLFMPTEAKGKKEGYKWASDDTSEDGTQKAVSIFAITKTTDDIVEITVNTSLSMSGNTKMMNFDVKQDLTGTRTSILSYSKSTGLLNGEAQDISMAGNAEVMGTAVPINSKGQITLAVQ